MIGAMNPFSCSDPLMLRFWSYMSMSSSVFIEENLRWTFHEILLKILSWHLAEACWWKRMRCLVAVCQSQTVESSCDNNRQKYLVAPVQVPGFQCDRVSWKMCVHDCKLHLQKERRCRWRGWGRWHEKDGEDGKLTALAALGYFANLFKTFNKWRRTQ